MVHTVEDGSVEDVTARRVPISKRIASVMLASSVVLYSQNAPDRE